MQIRERSEEIESKIVCDRAFLSVNSTRDRDEAPDPLRTAFQRDRDRILHSNSFRRLKHKTQVYIAPMGDHYRTRMTHTLEVAQIGRTMARALRLNEDLVEAIALGHDLGHTPFGHSVGADLLRIVCKAKDNGIEAEQQLYEACDAMTERVRKAENTVYNKK